MHHFRSITWVKCGYPCRTIPSEKTNAFSLKFPNKMRLQMKSCRRILFGLFAANNDQDSGEEGSRFKALGIFEIRWVRCEMLERKNYNKD